MILTSCHKTNVRVVLFITHIIIAIITTAIIIMATPYSVIDRKI